MVSVPRLWPGSTMAILATGPSLVQEDVDYCRGKVRVIAVNDSWHLAPWADVLYSSDQRWWPHHKGAPGFTGLKYGIAPEKKQATRFPKYPEIQVLRNTGMGGIEHDPTGLKTCLNSGGAAINLAVHFGAVRILLLGYNLGHIRGQKHFFGDHQGLSNYSPYQSFLRMFDSQVAPLKKLGVAVINCTPLTHLHCFPELPLREALPATAEVAA